MQLKVYPEFIFRTPRFSYQSTLSDSWKDLKAAIEISSPGFYDLIKDAEYADIEHLPEKIQFTIWKYFNRAKYRATPYGTFAAYSFCKPQMSPQSQIRIAERLELKGLLSWEHKNLLAPDAVLANIESVKLWANHTYYRSGDQLRYVAPTPEGFEIAQVEYQDFIIQILKHAAQPITLTQLFQVLELDAEDYQDLKDFVVELIVADLLLHSLQPNIIGEDYFKRIDFPMKESSNVYHLAKRPVIEAALAQNFEQTVLSYLKFISAHLPVEEHQSLKKFKENFGRKFETRAVPLMQALDPEMGVGYEDLEQMTATGFVHDYVPTAQKNIGLKEVLDKAFNKLFKTTEVYHLENLKTDQSAFNAKPIPNTFTGLAYMVDDLIVFEQLGGISANALNGRFSLEDAEVTALCQHLANIEQEANPEVLFFDVAYMAEGHVDNINRRNQIYPLQLSILNYDTSTTPLNIQDIYVLMVDNEIVLYSKQLKKRLIPRMATAYNYTRSDLSIFRLLCDLQAQSLRAQPVIDLQNIYPNQAFYPRLQYKNLVLSVAKWQYLKADRKTFPTLKAYLQHLKISRYFKAGRGDQTLCFDLNAASDLLAFENYAQKLQDFYIEEAFIPQESVVKDEAEQPYLAQYVFNFYHGEARYAGYENTLAYTDFGEDAREIYLPGSEWLYYEVFCHPQRSNHILFSLTNILQQYKHSLACWFFIRYLDQGPHLRIRFKLNDLQYLSALMLSLQQCFNAFVQQGFISDLQLKSYKPETARYGKQNMPRMEQWFALDSDYVLCLLQETLEDEAYYQVVMADMCAIGFAYFSPDAFLKLVQQISQSFISEHQFKAEDFKKLNQQVKQLAHLPESALSEPSVLRQHDMRHYFIKVLQEQQEKDVFGLFADMMHMHINRLFSNKQRLHEAVIYYYLHKNLLRNMKRV